MNSVPNSRTRTLPPTHASATSVTQRSFCWKLDFVKAVQNTPSKMNLERVAPQRAAPKLNFCRSMESVESAKSIRIQTRLEKSASLIHVTSPNFFWRMVDAKSVPAMSTKTTQPMVVFQMFAIRPSSF